MSLIAMNRIWDKSQATGTPLVVLLALADRADEDGICWPGVDWIAERARLQPRQARNVLRSLEASGEMITVNQRGRNQTNRYLITSGLDSDQIAAIVARRPDVFPSGCPQETGNFDTKNRQSGAENRQSSVNKTGNFETENRQFLNENRQSSVEKPAIAIAADPYITVEPPIEPPVVAVVTATTTTAAAAAIPSPNEKSRQTDPEWSAICTTYENEIGLLSPTVADELADLTKTYPANWITAAIAEAARANVRKLNYTVAILRRWATEGKNNANQDTNRTPAHRGPSSAKPADTAPENIYNQLLGWTTA